MKDHHSSFVFPATRSPSFLIATRSPSFVIATRSPSFVIATMPTSHPTQTNRLLVTDAAKEMDKEHNKINWGMVEKTGNKSPQ
jgi:hypothetical protein